MDSPLVTMILFAGAVYVAWLWAQDLQKWRGGQAQPGALPGATPASLAAIAVAVAGALLLVGIETAGELALGVAEQQSVIPVLFLLAMLGAGVLEEVIFRGYLVVSNRGRAMLIGSIICFSLLFALLHVQYYTEVEEGAAWWQFSFSLTPKSAWTLLILFMNSLWFYSVRFFILNPHQSLLPCVTAHAASNLAVFIIKAFQGHVVGWY